MFRDDYKRVNDGIHPDPELLERIRQRGAKRGTAWIWKAATIASACAVLVMGFFLVLPSLKADKAVPESTKDFAMESCEESAVVTEGAFDMVVESDLGIAPAESYSEIFALLSSGRDYAEGDVAFNDSNELVMDDGDLPTGMLQPETPALDPIPTDEAGAGGETLEGASDKNYSGTNTQVAGIDEGDIVKTDGDYIYIIKDQQTLYIVEVNGSEMNVASRTSLFENGGSLFVEDDDGKSYYNENRFALELYVYHDKLAIVVNNSYDGQKYVDGQESWYYGNDSSVLIYDISDRENPAVENELMQSGLYVDSRMVGEMLYVVSSSYVCLDYGINEDEPMGYCPVYRVNGGEKTVLDCSDIYVPKEGTAESFTVISCVDVKDNGGYSSIKASLGGSCDIYCNGDKLLVMAENYESQTGDELTDGQGRSYIERSSYTSTSFLLFELGTEIELTAQGEVRGSLLNQYSVDMEGGCIRVVVTRDESSTTIYTEGIDSYEYSSLRDNCLYVLDESFNLVSSIESLAEDEIIRSVRFMGDTVYFVTFRTTDPLFTVDLSDPAAPKVLSELRIDGFSSYLHSYGDGLLLGIGYNAYADTGAVTGVKISMFDISDPNAVFELFRMSVDANHTIASENYKAILVDAQKNIIAFPAEGNYYIFSYNADKGFELESTIALSDDDCLGMSDARGLYIDEVFYVVMAERIVALDMSALSLTASLDYAKDN